MSVEIFAALSLAHNDAQRFKCFSLQIAQTIYPSGSFFVQKSSVIFGAELCEPSSPAHCKDYPCSHGLKVTLVTHMLIPADGQGHDSTNGPHSVSIVVRG